MRRNTGLTALLKLPINELDSEIARCQMRQRTSTATPLRKKLANRLRKLKVIREKKHREIVAKKILIKSSSMHSVIGQVIGDLQK
jgi:hypothetical protein